LVQNVINYVVIIEVENPGLKLIPGLTANANIFIEERKNVFKVATNAFNFIPPLDYIQASILLPDSIKKFWIQKLHTISEQKKQQIVEVIGAKSYLWLIKDKDVFPIQVSKGLNDGSFTEINGDVKEGDAAATGINTEPTSTDKKTKSPFMPSFPSRKK
jgi:HlyD family secretion protein